MLKGMKWKLNGEGSPAKAGSQAGPQRKLGFARATLAAGLCLLAVGCATSNYNFDALSDASELSRVERMGEALAEREANGQTEDLHEVSMTPLLHTHLNVFGRSDDDGIPKGFVEADVNAYLPLFGVVDMKVNRYDDDLNEYESHNYDSYLWGLFQTHKERITTPVGLREEKTRRFLWFFVWRSAPKYVEVASS